VSAVSVSTSASTYNGPHPVPRGAALDDAHSLMRRAAAISVGLHLALLAGYFAISLWTKSGLVGTPQEEVIDVTIVPISALDTLLPKGDAEAVVAAPPLDVLKKEDPKTKPPAERPIEAVIDTPPSRAPKPKAQPESPSTSKAKDSDRPSAEATSSTGKIGVSNGTDISLEQARISYQDMIATLIARAKRYPERALKRRMTGEGAIRLEISSDGSLSNVEILRSTETQILDEELKAMAERAAPFPAFPSDLRKNKLALVVPIAFRLES